MLRSSGSNGDEIWYACRMIESCALLSPKRSVRRIYPQDKDEKRVTRIFSGPLKGGARFEFEYLK